MEFNLILDVVIGLILIYALFSLLASILQEIYAELIYKHRSKLLDATLYTIFDGHIPQSHSYGPFHRLWKVLRNTSFGNNGEKDETQSESFADLLRNHPLVMACCQGKRRPSYLAPNIVSDAVIEILEERYPSIAVIGTGQITYSHRVADSLKSDTASLSNGWRVIRGIATGAELNKEDFRQRIAEFFANATERSSGVYKRRSQRNLISIGLLIAIGFNVNTLHLVQEISEDEKLRANLLTYAEELEQNREMQTQLLGMCEADNTECLQSSLATTKALAQNAEKRADQVATTIAQLDLPIGWCSDKALSKANKTSESKIESSGSVVVKNKEKNASLLLTDRINLPLPEIGDASKGTEENKNACSPEKLVYWERDTANYMEFLDLFVRDLPGLLLTALAISLGHHFGSTY